MNDQSPEIGFPLRVHREASAERKIISLPGIVYFWDDYIGAVITGAIADIPFKVTDLVPDSDAFLDYSSNREHVNLRFSPEKRFFYIENNLWNRVENEDEKGLEARFDKSLALVLLINATLGGSPDLFHLGLNPKKEEGLWSLFSNQLEKKGLAKLLAIAASTEINLTDKSIETVRWLSQASGGKHNYNPSTLVNRLTHFLAEKPELQRQKVLPTDLKALYRQMRHDIQTVGIDGIVV